MPAPQQASQQKCAAMTATPCPTCTPQVPCEPCTPPGFPILAPTPATPSRHVPTGMPPATKAPIVILLLATFALITVPVLVSWWRSGRGPALVSDVWKKAQLPAHLRQFKERALALWLHVWKGSLGERVWLLLLQRVSGGGMRAEDYLHGIWAGPRMKAVRQGAGAWRARVTGAGGQVVSSAASFVRTLLGTTSKASDVHTQCAQPTLMLLLETLPAGFVAMSSPM